MTQSFNDWLEDNPNKSYANIYELGLVAFEAGAASRQAEIDALNALGEMSEQKIDDLVLRNIELQKQIDTLKQEVTREREQGTEFFTDCEHLKAERDALQRRIDEALKYTSESPLKDVSRKAMLNFLDILKGESE